MARAAGSGNPNTGTVASVPGTDMLLDRPPTCVITTGLPTSDRMPATTASAISAEFAIKVSVKTASTESSGMQSLDRCLLGYVKARLIDREEALKTAGNPETLALALAQLPRELD